MSEPNHFGWDWKTHKWFYKIVDSYLEDHESFLLRKIFPKLGIFRKRTNRISKILEKFAKDNRLDTVMFLLEKYRGRNINMKLILRGFAYAGNLDAIKKLLNYEHMTTPKRKLHYGTIDCALVGAFCNNQIRVAEELLKFPTGFVQIKKVPDLPSYRSAYYLPHNPKLCLIEAKKHNAKKSIQWLKGKDYFPCACTK